MSVNNARRLEGLAPLTQLPGNDDQMVNLVQDVADSFVGISEEVYKLVKDTIDDIEQQQQQQRQQMLDEWRLQAEEDKRVNGMFMRLLMTACDLGEEVCEVSFDIDDMESFIAHNTLYAAKVSKEVTFRNLSPGDKLKFEEAVAQEVSEVLQAQALRAMKESEKGQPNDDKEIPMRWLLTWKPVEGGDDKAKARIILIGYKHPDLVKKNFITGKPELQTAAPTMSRTGRNMLL